MPESIARLLAAEDDSNNVTGVIPKLARLLEQRKDLDVAYLCTDAVIQVHKLKDEGAHFCGYRNMQTLCLGLGNQNHQSPRPVGGRVDLSRKLPVAKLQAMIEGAWDAGINAHARQQTGGITGTRKHVGTSEAEALLLSLGIECTGAAFKGKTAYLQLLDAVESYYTASPALTSMTKVHRTARPPIFLQRPGHSITIVGVEMLKGGRRKLLVFDPAWRPPSAMRGEDELRQGWKGMLVLKQYAKGERHFRKYQEFEILTVD